MGKGILLRILGLVAFATALFAVPQIASAASVVYVGSDGNVHLASPDGSVKHRVTSDGTSSDGYLSPSQTNAGEIVAIRKAGASAIAYFLNRQNGDLIKTWNVPKEGSGSIVPYTGAQIAQSGGMLVYDWWYFDCATNPCSSRFDISFVSGPGKTQPCDGSTPCHSGFVSPRWIPDTPYAGFITDGFSEVWAQTSSGPQGWIALSDSGVPQEIQSFDTRGGRTLLEFQAPDAADGAPVSLALLRNTGAPPAATEPLCAASNFAPLGAAPRFSPDGSMIAWQGSDGVYTSPAPVPQSNGTCTLQPKLVAAGGKWPDWGPASTPGGGGGGGTLPGDDPTDPGGDDTTSSAGCTTAKKKLKKAKKTVKKRKKAYRKTGTKTAKKKLSKAKKKLKKAKRKKRNACAPTTSRRAPTLHSYRPAG